MSSSSRVGFATPKYDRICTLHGKKISDEDLCPSGHVALAYERRIRHEPLVPAGSEKKAPIVPTPPRPPSSPHPTASQAAASGGVSTAPPGAPQVMTKSQLLKPRRFIDEQNRVMTLRVKDTKANGWAVHCKLEQPHAMAVGGQGKLKVVQQGLTRIGIPDQEAAKVVFFELCTASMKAGWADAPLRGRKLMEIPKPLKARDARD